MQLSFATDLNGDTKPNALDVQLVINATLGTVS